MSHHLFSLSTVRRAMEHDFVGRLPRGKQVVDTVLAHLRGDEKTVFRGGVGDTAKTLLASKSAAPELLSAGTFAEAQVSPAVQLVRQALLAHPPTNSPTHSTHLLTHSFNRSLTHSLTHY